MSVCGGRDEPVGAMQCRSADRDFSGYNAAQAARPVRPLARAAVSLALEGPLAAGQVPGALEAGPGPVALELGSGIGVETRFLAENGFEVHSYDVDPSVAGTLAALARSLPIIHTTADLAQVEAFPAADLVVSCATLPFVRRDEFSALWGRILDSLRPGGILAVDLFGDRDDWASTDGTFLSRDEVEQLLRWTEVLELVEEEREGRSFSGPKHWHTFRVIARCPQDAEALRASRRP